MAGWIAAGIIRPIRDLTAAAEAMAAGELDQDVETGRKDEIGTLASAFVAMRSAIHDKVNTLEAEVRERTSAENRLAEAQGELQRSNERLEETVKARTAELAAKEKQLRVALTNMSEGIFTIDKDRRYQMFNQRYVDMMGLPPEMIAAGVPVEDVITYAAEAGYYGPGDPRELARIRLGAMTSAAFEEVESPLPDGRVLNYRKSPLADGGAIVVVSDVTERRKSERELESAYGQISSSIEYASNIQRALLPDADTRRPVLGEHFVAWQPKDVVGGDFYWIREWGEGRLLALGDCTGHGVPGAFMTLIATATLNRSLRETPPGEVGQLMSCINGRIQTVLGQGGENAMSDDGMELGVVYMPTAGDTVVFGGAGLSLFARNADEVVEFRGSRSGVGFKSVATDTTYKVVEIERAAFDEFYLASDGVFDQTGGERGHGFGKRRFKEAIMGINGQTFETRKSSLLSVLQAYQGSQPRRDDITIIGFESGK